MKFIVDRIEGKFAICENQENKKMVSIPLNLLPSNIKEGILLVYENNKYTIDDEGTKNRTALIQEKMDKLWN